jgi:hypothetical protein
MMPWMLMLALACGDKDTDTSGDTAADTTEELVCDDTTWDDEGSAEFMSSCVLPEMAALFEEYDGEAYADFSCTSCHGDDLGGGSYAMPGAVAISVREQDPNSDLYQFMYGSVMPTMAGIIGREAYDVSTGEGDFSCYSCHQEAR